MNSRAAFLLLSLAILHASVAKAEEPVRSTQEELRRRNLYFGDIDGSRSPEYEAAVKRYQQRKGFAASGKEDPDTLRSLGLRPRSPNEPAPKELEWPAETVLRSDTHLNVVQEAQEVAKTAGVAPQSLVPVPMPYVIAGVPYVIAGVPYAIASGHGLRTHSRKGRPASFGRAVAAVPAGVASKGTQTVSQADVMKLLSRFLSAVSKGDLEDELSLYADRVHYYSNGLVDRRIIEHQARKYYKQWPSRSYRLTGVSGFRAMPGSGEITVTYKVAFSLKSPRGQAKGATLNRVVLNAATSSPRIVAIEEHRVPN